MGDWLQISPKSRKKNIIVNAGCDPMSNSQLNVACNSTGLALNEKNSRENASDQGKGMDLPGQRICKTEEGRESVHQSPSELLPCRLSTTHCFPNTVLGHSLSRSHLSPSTRYGLFKMAPIATHSSYGQLLSVQSWVL